MEMNKTLCKDCRHVNRWYSYKWAGTPSQQEHNRVNNTTCPNCKSTNVENVEDSDTMGAYNMAADILSGKR